MVRSNGGKPSKYSRRRSITQPRMIIGRTNHTLGMACVWPIHHRREWWWSCFYSWIGLFIGKKFLIHRTLSTKVWQKKQLLISPKQIASLLSEKIQSVAVANRMGNSQKYKEIPIKYSTIISASQKFHCSSVLTISTPQKTRYQISWLFCSRCLFLSPHIFLFHHQIFQCSCIFFFTLPTDRVCLSLELVIFF